MFNPGSLVCIAYGWDMQYHMKESISQVAEAGTVRWVKSMGCGPCFWPQIARDILSENNQIYDHIQVTVQ